jgi:two-component system, LytTR family, response regulator
MSRTISYSLKVLIIDADKKNSTQLQKMLSETAQVTKVYTCEKPEHALDIAMEHEIDLVFVDFLVPGMNGIGFLSDLPYHRPHLVVISEHEKVAREAYDHEALDFILKPVKSSRVMTSLARAIKMDERKQSKIQNYDSLFVKVNSRLLKIMAKEIYLVEAAADYLKVYTDKKTYTIYSNFKRIMERLSAKDFMRIHRSFIVRIDRISTLEDNMVKVEDHLVPVSNTYRAALMERLKIL